MEKKGRLDVITGCMFSGKTEQLMNIIDSLVSNDENVKVFNHIADESRSGDNTLMSHNNKTFPATMVSDPMSIVDLVDELVGVVIIDEIQFFNNNIIFAVDSLIANGIDVVVAGLDLDFRGEPFENMSHLLSIADNVHKMKAICKLCKGIAMRTQRIINGQPASYDDEIILVGGKEYYEPRCKNCFEILY